MSSASRQPSRLILYGDELSPAVRAVLMTLKALDLTYEFREINLAAGEHLKASFVQKNPQHTVPLLEDHHTTTDDDGDAVAVQCVWDSHAICAYLVRKYATGSREDDDDSSLYPRDYYRRAVVDQRLHYESGVLFATCLNQITHPLFSGQAKDKEQHPEIPKDKIAQIHNAYAMLETFLCGGDDDERTLFMAGESLTIADFSIVSTVSSLDAAFTSVDARQYPKLAAWLERMKALPFYEEANGRGVRAFRERVRSKLPKQFDKLWQKAFADIKQSGKQSTSTQE